MSLCYYDPEGLPSLEYTAKLKHEYAERISVGGLLFCRSSNLIYYLPTSWTASPNLTDVTVNAFSCTQEVFQDPRRLYMTSHDLGRPPKSSTSYLTKKTKCLSGRPSNAHRSCTWPSGTSAHIVRFQVMSGSGLRPPK